MEHLTLEKIEMNLDAAELAYKLARTEEQEEAANQRVNYWYGQLKLKLDELDLIEEVAA